MAASNKHDPDEFPALQGILAANRLITVELIEKNRLIGRGEMLIELLKIGVKLTKKQSDFATKFCEGK